MSKVTVNSSNIIDKIKPMHATNNAPVISPDHPSKMRDNFKALEISYERIRAKVYGKICSSSQGNAYKTRLRRYRNNPERVELCP